LKFLRLFFPTYKVGFSFLILIASVSYFSQSLEPIIAPIPGAINSRLQEFGPSLTRDGRKMYFYSKKNEKSFTDIYFSELEEDGNWGVPELFDVLNSKYDDQSPFLTRDETEIFFSSNRDGSVEVELPGNKIGISRDIYLSKFNNGKWSIPESLPKQVNTEEIEENPHFQGDTLFFTRYPFGKPEKASIYKSIRKGNTWSKAEKLPGPINDENSTISFTLNDEGNLIFFASNRPGGYGGYDLYLGRWDGKSGEDIENMGYGINTPKDEAYLVYHQKDKIFYFCRWLEGRSFDIYYVKMPRVETIIEQAFNESNKLSLDSIKFEKASAALKAESKEPLDAILAYLNLNPKIRIRIVGHTDLNGDYDENMELSRKRARSVKEYFVERGINTNRIETDGKGPKEPLVPKNDEESSRKNRRTEFLILEEP